MDATIQPRTEALPWLLGGDVAVQLQTYRDLLDEDRPDLQVRVASEGDAAAILAARAAGGWGPGFYGQKWTSPHYSLLELRDLGVPRDEPGCVDLTATALTRFTGADGGFNPTDSVKESDVCMNGMFLAFACYFHADPPALESVVDFVLGQQMADGGFNCRSNRSGARVASVHSTTSVIDGLAEYQRRADGEPIREELTRFHHPARWHFDVLRGLDVLRAADAAYDPRLDDALTLVQRRRRADGRWAAAAQYPGRTHVEYPRAGTPNRWVTLRALRVLHHFEPQSAALLP